MTDELRERVAYLEGDISRLRREARERDQVINELYQRIDALEKRLAEQMSASGEAEEDDEGARLRDEYFGED